MSQSSQCPTCKHFWGLSACEAFPDGIPEEIISGEFVHDEKHPKQDNSIVREEGRPEIELME